jgi:citrate synthase
VSQELGLPPRHELGALAVAQAIGLPRYSTGAVFMLARTAGWVAHVQEQRRAGQMIRPRAKFVAAGA